MQSLLLVQWDSLDDVTQPLRSSNEHCPGQRDPQITQSVQTDPNANHVAHQVMKTLDWKVLGIDHLCQFQCHATTHQLPLTSDPMLQWVSHSTQLASPSLHHWTHGGEEGLDGQIDAGGGSLLSSP